MWACISPCTCEPVVSKVNAMCELSVHVDVCIENVRIGVNVNLFWCTYYILRMNVHLYAEVCISECKNGARDKMGLFGVNRCLSL